jgi:hypothetical protein
MSPMLVVVSGPDRGRSFPLLEGQTLQVGRSQATATRLSDPTVSRVHCEVEWDGRKAVVINISTSGTLVNGKAVAQHDLEPGDVIRVGSSELRFQLGPVAEAPTQPPPAKPARPSDLGNLVGQTLSHFALEGLIARGASGAVFRARDTNDGKTVALKVLQPEFAKHEEEMQRFIRAMKTVLPLPYPNLVALQAAGKTGARKRRSRATASLIRPEIKPSS